ncbi:hypothetical protein Tco_0020763 [Tanacetum coccineum]
MLPDVMVLVSAIVYMVAFKSRTLSVVGTWLSNALKSRDLIEDSESDGLGFLDALGEGSIEKGGWVSSSAMSGGSSISSLASYISSSLSSLISSSESSSRA